MTAVTGKRKRDFRLVVYHLLSAIAVIYFTTSGSFKSGPCTPNLDVLGFFIATAASIVLTFYSLVMVARNRENKYFLFINLAAMLIWLSIFYWNS